MTRSARTRPRQRVTAQTHDDAARPCPTRLRSPIATGTTTRRRCDWHDRNRHLAPAAATTATTVTTGAARRATSITSSASRRRAATARSRCPTGARRSSCRRTASTTRSSAARCAGPQRLRGLRDTPFSERAPVRARSRKQCSGPQRGRAAKPLFRKRAPVRQHRSRKQHCTARDPIPNEPVRSRSRTPIGDNRRGGGPPNETLTALACVSRPGVPLCRETRRARRLHEPRLIASGGRLLTAYNRDPPPPPATPLRVPSSSARRAARARRLPRALRRRGRAAARRGDRARMTWNRRIWSPNNAEVTVAARRGYRVVA